MFGFRKPGCLETPCSPCTALGLRIDTTSMSLQRTSMPVGNTVRMAGEESHSSGQHPFDQHPLNLGLRVRIGKVVARAPAVEEASNIDLTRCSVS